MARRTSRPQATRIEVIDCIEEHCPACQRPMWIDYENDGTVAMMTGVVRLILKVRRGQNRECARYHKPYRPECEGGWALPKHEFGLDVLAAIGEQRYRHHRTVGEIHVYLQAAGVVISERSVTNLLDRYDELVALSLQTNGRLQGLLKEQEQVILAIDGLQPDVGHEVLWVVRDCLSGEVLGACAMLSSAQDDLANWLEEIKQMLPVPVIGQVSDGQQSLRKAVTKTFPGVVSLPLPARGRPPHL